VTNRDGAAPAPPRAGPPVRRRRSAPPGALVPPARLPVVQGEPGAAGAAPTGEAAPGEPEVPATRERPRRLRRSRTAGAPPPGRAAVEPPSAAGRVLVASAAEASLLPGRRGSIRPKLKLVGEVMLAAGCWLALGALVYGVDPENALARAVFFLLLYGALFFTLAPVLRRMARRFPRSRLYQEAAAMHARRQALMLSAFVVLNALLQLVRAWSALSALLLFGMFAVIEVVALARR